MPDILALEPGQWPFGPMETDYIARHDAWREVTSDHYDYALNVLPPVAWRGGAFMISEPHTHETDGVAVLAAFVRIGSRHFGRYLRRDAFGPAVTALARSLS